MTKYFLATIALLIVKLISGQEPANIIDPLNITNSFSEIYKYKNPKLKYQYIDKMQMHDYSDNWDIDNDKINDSIYFVGNGGAHIYYKLVIVLSESRSKNEYNYIQLDNPVLDTCDNKTDDWFNKLKNYYFVVSDFDNDGCLDVFVNVDVKHNSYPLFVKKRGITSNLLMISYKNKRLEVGDLKQKKGNKSK